MAHNLQTPIPTFLEYILEGVREHDAGDVADYIPELAQADPTPLAFALTTGSGRTYAVGDVDREFSIQSISKPFTYALALQQYGYEKVFDLVGVEPSGEAFNELSLEGESKRPMNPMINAGAIVTNQLINGDGCSVEERVEIIRRTYSDLAGRDLSVDSLVNDSELSHADRNLAIAHMLRSYGRIQDEAEDAVRSYIAQCSINVTVRDLSMMAATLANGGTQPVTGKQVFSQEVCRLTTAVMASAGMYNGAGKWMARIGIPAKSGVSGGLLGVLPGQLGLASFSPRLDAEGNSVRGRLMFQELSDLMGLHLMNPDPLGIAPVRAIREEDNDSIVTLQGQLNFSAVETLLHTICQEEFTTRRIVLDLSRVVRANQFAKRMLSLALSNMVENGYEIAVRDDKEREFSLALQNGTNVPVLCEIDGNDS